MESKVQVMDTSNSEVSFQVKKLCLFTITGSITGFTGEVSFSKEAVTDSHLSVCISPSTINTGNSKRDEHLKSKDFVFVKEHPKICLRSDSVQITDNGYLAVGNLSMLGISKKVDIPFLLEENFLVGKLTLNRSEFSLGAKFPAFIIGKTIQITIHCKIKQS